MCNTTYKGLQYWEIPTDLRVGERGPELEG